MVKIQEHIDKINKIKKHINKVSTTCEENLRIQTVSEKKDDTLNIAIVRR